MVSAPVHGTKELLLKQKQISGRLKTLGRYMGTDLQETRSILIPRSVNLIPRWVNRFHQALNLSWAPLRQPVLSLIAAEYMHCHFFSSRSARILCVYVRDRLKMACAGDNDGGLTCAWGLAESLRGTRAERYGGYIVRICEDRFSRSKTASTLHD